MKADIIVVIVEGVSSLFCAAPPLTLLYLRISTITTISPLRYSVPNGTRETARERQSLLSVT
jgi:hypothetical protein